MSNDAPEKMKLTSMDVAQEKRARLKQLFPEVFTEDRIDFEQLRHAMGDWVEPGKERYGLNWPGKAECMKIIQTPSIATLKPARDESVDFDTTENLFIEGDNLEVLKLLQKSYFGKVKMVYIDPPYNTGNDFIYPDKYAETLDTYLAYTGQIDDKGKKFSTSAETAGRHHSQWMNMIYPRLYLARNLLTDNGLIFISIDDGEIANLRSVCDLIFGEDNFIASLVWKSRQIVDSRPQNNVSNDHEYIVVYGKGAESKVRGKEIDKGKYSNPDNDARGLWMSNSILGLANKSQRPNLHYKVTDPETGLKYPCPPESGWRYSKETMQEKIDDKRIVFPSKPDGRPREKKFLSELSKDYTGFSSILPLEVGYTLNGTREVRDLFEDNLFPFPKPVSLLKELITQGIDNQKNAIVLDFFAGSATTAEAIMQLNKEISQNIKYVLVQLPEPTEEKSNPYNAGYKNIADLSKERIRRAAKKIEKEQNGQLDLNGNGNIDLGFRVFKLFRSNFNVWEGDIEKIKNLEEQLALHVDHIDGASTPEDILYELLLRAGFPLTTSVQKTQMAEKDVFSIEDGAMLICLDKDITPELIDALADADPLQVICLDEGFKGNDQLKTNAVQTFKARAASRETEIVFRTV